MLHASPYQAHMAATAAAAAAAAATAGGGAIGESTGLMAAGVRSRGGDDAGDSSQYDTDTGGGGRGRGRSGITLKVRRHTVCLVFLFSYHLFFSVLFSVSCAKFFSSTFLLSSWLTIYTLFFFEFLFSFPVVLFTVYDLHKKKHIFSRRLPFTPEK